MNNLTRRQIVAFLVAVALVAFIAARLGASSGVGASPSSAGNNAPQSAPAPWDWGHKTDPLQQQQQQQDHQWIQQQQQQQSTCAFRTDCLAPPGYTFTIPTQAPIRLP